MKGGNFIASLDWGLITEWENQLLVKPTIDNNCIIYNICVAAFMEVLHGKLILAQSTNGYNTPPFFSSSNFVQSQKPKDNIVQGKTANFQNYM